MLLQATLLIFCQPNNFESFLGNYETLQDVNVKDAEILIPKNTEISISYIHTIIILSSKCCTTFSIKAHEHFEFYLVHAHYELLRSGIRVRKYYKSSKIQNVHTSDLVAFTMCIL